ncbi:MAG: hypothetical protein ACC662_02690, partial [Planctomycetota bacterium]
MKLFTTTLLGVLAFVLLALPATAGGPIALELVAQPASVPAGGSTLVTVVARSPETGELVAGASVSLRASGGYFGLSARASRGSTDERGIFRTVWRSEGPERIVRDTSYVILVQVTHPEHEAAAGSLPIRVTVRAAPEAPGEWSLRLTVAARPEEVPAGGEAELLVQVSDENGEPVRDAVVRAAVGGGTFAGGNGALATGRTDGSGVWRVRWRSEDRSAYRDDTRYVILVEATKKGYRSAAGQQEILVTMMTAVPPARVRTMAVEARANPVELGADGSTAILVMARSDAGEAIAGARVRVQLDGDVMAFLQ